MTTEEKYDNIQACFDNICKNYEIPAGLHIADLTRDRTSHDRFNTFIDVHTSSHISIFEEEVWRNLLGTGIKSKHAYRKLRSLIRAKLISSIYDLHNLAEESLRNLGVKI